MWCSTNGGGGHFHAPRRIFEDTMAHVRHLSDPCVQMLPSEQTSLFHTAALWERRQVDELQKDLQEATETMLGAKKPVSVPPPPTAVAGMQQQQLTLP
jgi:hypothetical protein